MISKSVTPPTNAPSPVIVSLIVAFSGFCSLVYQVVWDRTLRYNFGGDSISSAIVTATFLLGLGIGAFIFGKWRKRAYVTYAMVEIGIGLYAIVSFYILSSLAVILGQIFSYSIEDVDGLRAIVVVACILFLLPPCILMGGTLPLMFNCFIRPGAYQNKTVGLIYGLNTAGASIGILAVPFLFLNHISIPATLLITGTGNILLGIGIWFSARKFTWADNITEINELLLPDPHSHTLTIPSILTLSFLSGFITLSFEISLLRTVGLLAPSSPYLFPFVLMPFLLALAVGSIIFTRFKHYSIEAAVGRVGILFVLAMIGLLSTLVTRYFSPVNLLLIIMPLPLLIGGVFPLLLRLASNQSQELPRRTGLIYLSNSAGSFLGAMLSQFLGFPYLGTQGLVITLFLMGLITGTICLLWSVPKLKILTPSLANLLALPALALAFTPLFIPLAIWDTYTFNHTGTNIDKIEGVSGVAVINWTPEDDLGHIEVNGQYMSALPDHPKHIRLESVALAMPRREHVLVLGLGGGGMIRELVNDPEIKRIDIVDWSNELPLVLQRPKARVALEDALDNPKVRLFWADARVAASLYNDQTFDMIIDNLGYLGWVGSTSTKSVTYFHELSRILKPTGVFVFDANYVGQAAREAVLAGLLKKFQYVREHKTVIVLASNQVVEIDPDRAEEVLERRGKVLGLAKPYANWLLKGFKPITAQDLKNPTPVFDELLIHEYTLFNGIAGNP